MDVSERTLVGLVSDGKFVGPRGVLLGKVVDCMRRAEVEELSIGAGV